MLALGNQDIPSRWIALVPLCLVAGGYALSYVLFRNEMAIRREPAWRLHVASLRETVEAHLERGRTVDALLVLNEWLREDPHSAEAWVLLARLDAANGRLSRARLAYQRANRWDEKGRFRDEIRHALEVLGGLSR
jgi:cytochrome c-type biogenesis protein CcmH/NrfG